MNSTKIISRAYAGLQMQLTQQQQPQKEREDQHTSSLTSDALIQFIKDREIAYLLSGTRLSVKQSLPKIDIGSVHLEALNQGDAVDLPRWIAEVFTSLGFCEYQEESFSAEVFKAVNREKMAGQNQLAEIRRDFYLKVRRHLAYARELVNSKPTMLNELERTKMFIYDLIAMRLRKILTIAASLSPPADIRDKLTPEEYELFDAVYSMIRSWRIILTEGR